MVGRERKKETLDEFFEKQLSRFRRSAIKVPLGVVEAVDGNIKAQLRRGRGYRNLNYLLPKAQQLAATKTEFVAFQKAA